MLFACCWTSDLLSVGFAMLCVDDKGDQPIFERRTTPRRKNLVTTFATWDDAASSKYSLPGLDEVANAMCRVFPVGTT